MVKVTSKPSELRKLLRGKEMATKEKNPHLLNSGTTLGNLSISGRWTGAYLPGSYYLMPGDSDSGKTWLAHCALAEAANDPFFDDYTLRYDDPEYGSLMNMAHFFGDRAASRVKVCHSESVEDMWDRVYKLVSSRPTIYITDSMDALVPRAEMEREKKARAARERGQEEAGTYALEKAKLNGKGLRNCIGPIRKSKSILIIISQSKDEIGKFGFGDKKRYAGGKSLKFFCEAQIWTSLYGELKRPVPGASKKNEQIGITCKLQVKRSRQTGRHRAVRFPIYHSYGIDDLGSCVDWLVEWGHWTKKGGAINAKEFDIRAQAKELIKHIESEGMEDALRIVVSKKWKSIEDSLRIERKKRYV